MLQQTTVPAVAARYEGFLRRFPTIEKLALAREESVLAAWSGLGYYARARNLRRAAREVVARHGGVLPDDPENLQSLPGFGPYMANAVPALAYGRYVLPVDANIRRVLARFLASDHPENGLPGLVSRRRPGDSIAALFDLGQLVCRPKNPRCGDCPVRGFCAARRRGEAALFPRPKPRRPRETVHVAAAVLAQGGRLFLERRPSGWLAGLWQFPCEESSTPTAARRRLARRFGRLPSDPLATARHAIVHRDLHIRAYAVSADRAPDGGRWAAPSQLGRSAVASLTRKIADRVRSPAAV